MTTLSTAPGGTTDRAIVGVFDDRLAAEQAVDALERAGFGDDQLGFVIRGADDVRGGMIVDAEGEARYYEREFNSGRAIVAVRPNGRAAEAAEMLIRFGGRGVHCEAHSPIRTEGVFSTP